MLILVVLTNFWKKEPKMLVLCHLDHIGAKTLFWSILAKLNMILKFLFFMRRVMYTHHACFIHLNPSWCQGPWCITRYAFQKVLTFLLTRWPTPIARILTVWSYLLVNGLWLSIFLNVTNVMVSSNVLNWVEVRWLGRSRQLYFFSMSQQTRNN